MQSPVLKQFFRNVDSHLQDYQKPEDHGYMFGLSLSMLDTKCETESLAEMTCNLLEGHRAQGIKTAELNVIYR
jgi:hypothetical protein